MDKQLNIKGHPFYLDDRAEQWVWDTFENLTTDEKIGQLFLPIGYSTDQNYLDGLLAHHIGGLFFRPGPADEVRQTYAYVQKKSTIPLLTAANLEDGGNGAIAEGTAYGRQMAVAATADPKDAYTLGRIAATDAKAVGVNWGFSPVVDLDLNFRNPITNVRTYGSHVDKVIACAKEYIHAFHEKGLMTSIKHFPGDGVDERDQHLLTSVNSLSVDAWWQTFGKVYRELIEAGSKAVMVGHIAFPAYTNDQVPATLNPKLLNNLLREELQFNGLVITDATPMVGFTTVMERKQAVPFSIEAGCDMFLFNRDFAEDLQYMKDGLKNGILSARRLDQAVLRILATKASLGLHLGVEEPSGDLLDYSQEQKDLADRAVTLVQDKASFLPLQVTKHKRILLQVLGNFASNQRITEKVHQELTQRGFEVSIYQPEENFYDLGTVQEFKDRYDLVLYVANVENAINQTVARIHWHTLFGLGNNLPWFVKEVPTVLLSLGNPYHLFDLPMVETVVNAYCNYDHFIEASIEKLASESPFKGVSPINPLCHNDLLEDLQHGTA